MAVPDYVVSGRHDPIPTATGLLSDAQATAAPGTEATGAKRSGIDPRKDKPQSTESCPGCSTCEPAASAGRAF